MSAISWKDWFYYKTFGWLETKVAGRVTYHEEKIAHYESKLSELHLLTLLDRQAGRFDADKIKLARWAEGAIFRQIEHHTDRLKQSERHLLTVRTILKRFDRWFALRRTW